MSHRSFQVDPVHEFSAEIVKIKDPMVRLMTAIALGKAPDYVWFVPASSSGKYHPKSSLGMGGLIRHVKSVFWVSEELLAHPTYTKFSESHKDLIRSAILLHDMAKQGLNSNSTRTVTEHPLLVKEGLNPCEDMAEVEGVNMDEVKSKWDVICSLIETHMGPWTTDRETGKEVLSPPTSPDQWFVHLCDYIASRKIIEVDFVSRQPQFRN